MPRRCGPNCSARSSALPHASVGVASAIIDVLLDAPAATVFAFASGALVLLLGATVPMQMLLSLLVALYCPRLLIAIGQGCGRRGRPRPACHPALASIVLSRHGRARRAALC